MEYNVYVVNSILSVHLLTALADRFSPSFFHQHGLISSKVLEDNQYHRLWSASWVHAHWSHWLLNSLMLLCLGYGISSPLSAAGFLFIYLVSSVGGTVLALYVSRADQSGEPHGIGAAGGVSGVLLASLTLSPSLALTIPQLAIALPLWPLAVVFLTVSVFALKPHHSTMTHDAHLGGAIVGLLLSPVVAPEPLQTTLWLAIGLLLPTVVLVYALVKAPEVIAMTPAGLPDEQGASGEAPGGEEGSPMAEPRYKTSEDEMNALLDRIGQIGYRSLTDYERERLQTIATGEIALTEK